MSQSPWSTIGVGVQDHSRSTACFSVPPMLSCAATAGPSSRSPASGRQPSTPGGRGIVVANGAESEPASGKDAALLQLRPHLVLDGLKATVRATGSTEAVLWLHKGALHSRVSIERALVERRAAGVTDVPIRIVEGPARYLSGESTAIVRALWVDRAAAHDARPGRDQRRRRSPHPRAQHRDPGAGWPARGGDRAGAAAGC